MEAVAAMIGLAKGILESEQTKTGLDWLNPT